MGPVLLIGVSAAVAVLLAFVLRTRLHSLVVGVLLAAAGAAIGLGGILLQAGASDVEVGLVVGSMAVLVPLHVHIVVGPLGRQ